MMVSVFDEEDKTFENEVSQVEEVKKEADQLMINKMIQYEAEINTLKKEIPMIREDVQVEILQKDKRIQDLEMINKQHQKQVGDLIKDNKELAKQIQDKNEIVEKLRKAGVL